MHSAPEPTVSIDLIEYAAIAVFGFFSGAAGVLAALRFGWL
jgi:hypothetical protein